MRFLFFADRSDRQGGKSLLSLCSDPWDEKGRPLSRHYVMKLDTSKFFYRIDHQVSLDLIGKKCNYDPHIVVNPQLPLCVVINYILIDVSEHLV